MIAEDPRYMGCHKITRIMKHTMWVCEVCGVTHDHRNRANSCCSGEKRRLNKEKLEHVPA